MCESESESEESEEDLSEQDSYDPDTDSFDYAIDAEDDIDFEREFEAVSESESLYESEAESEDYSERDSYNPSDDSFDYAVDAEDSVVFATSASESAQSEVESSVTESEVESEAESVADSVSVSESEQAEIEDRESVELGAGNSMARLAFDLYEEEMGEEASPDDIRGIFAEVLQMFADEAEEEQYDETTDEDIEIEEQDESATESDA